MARTISLATRNLMTVAEAKQKVTTGFGELRDAYIAHLGRAEFTWEGDTAHFTVNVLAQEVTAELAVTAENLSLEIHLPWLLAGFAPLIESVIVQKAVKTIPIEDDEPKA